MIRHCSIERWLVGLCAKIIYSKFFGGNGTTEAQRHRGNADNRFFNWEKMPFFESS